MTEPLRMCNFYCTFATLIVLGIYTDEHLLDSKRFYQDRLLVKVGGFSFILTYGLPLSVTFVRPDQAAAPCTLPADGCNYLQSRSAIKFAGKVTIFFSHMQIFNVIKSFYGLFYAI